MAKRRQFSHAERRPLLFICHSLGGVVVKRALVIAHERSRRYNSIIRDTFGIMFLGTPHRGSNAAFWGKLFGSLADVLTLGSIRTQLLGDLKRKSDVLGATCLQFVERSQSLRRIFSIYERVRIKGLPGLVVEEDSAIMGLLLQPDPLCGLDTAVDPNPMSELYYPRESLTLRMTKSSTQGESVPTHRAVLTPRLLRVRKGVRDRYLVTVRMSSLI
jgi:hypothetical protein